MMDYKITKTITVPFLDQRRILSEVYAYILSTIPKQSSEEIKTQQDGSVSEAVPSCRAEEISAVKPNTPGVYHD